MSRGERAPPLPMLVGLAPRREILCNAYVAAGASPRPTCEVALGFVASTFCLAALCALLAPYIYAKFLPYSTSVAFPSREERAPPLRKRFTFHLTPYSFV